MLCGLYGRRLLVTGGPTRAYLDDVRYITNHSTGRLGSLLAEFAADMGAEVLYVQGKGSIRPKSSPRLRVLEVETVEDLIRVMEVEVGSQGFDAVIHSMAVLDFEPDTRLAGKVNSSRSEWLVRLIPTPKVVNRVKELDPQVFLVAFKLEALGDRREAGDPKARLSPLVAAARRLMESSKADIVVANALETARDEAAHEACILLADGDLVLVRGKEQIARAVVSLVGRMLAERKPQGNVEEGTGG